MLPQVLRARRPAEPRPVSVAAPRSRRAIALYPGESGPAVCLCCENPYRTTGWHAAQPHRQPLAGSEQSSMSPLLLTCYLLASAVVGSWQVNTPFHPYQSRFQHPSGPPRQRLPSRLLEAQNLMQMSQVFVAPEMASYRAGAKPHWCPESEIRLQNLSTLPKIRSASAVHTNGLGSRFRWSK